LQSNALAGRVAELGSLGRNISSDWVFTLFMKTTMKTVLGLITTVMLVGCATPERQSTAWEYKIVHGQLVGQLQEQINKAAADGWIFVSTAGQGEQSGYAVMKRLKK